MRLNPTWAALLLCAALAVERLLPALRAPGAVLVGDWHHPDCLGNHWLMVWVAERLRAGQSLLHNTAYYFPIGDHPWLAGNGSEGLLYLPLHLLLGWPVGVAAYSALTLTANGLAGYALGRAAGAGPWAGLVSAAACSTSAYAVQEMGSGRFSQANLAFLVGALAAWVWLLREPGRGRAALGGLLTAAAAVLYWYHGLFLLLAVGLLVAVRGVLRAPPAGAAVVGAGALALALAAPVLAIYAANWSLIPGVGEAVFPHPEAVQDSLTLGRPFAVQGGRESYSALPLPLVALGVLALAGAVRRVLRREGEPTELGLWAVCGVFFLLALGVNGPLYEPLYGTLGPLRRFWWPHRHIGVAYAAFGALAAVQLGRLAGRRVGLVGVLVALSLSPALRLQGDPVGVPTSPVALPPVLHEQLRAEPGEVVLHLPFTPEVASTQTALIYQLYHRKAMLNGHAPWVSRVRPAAWDALVQHNSFLAALAGWERGQLQGELVFEAEDLRALTGQGFAWIVLEREQFPLPLRGLYAGYRSLLEELFGRPTLRYGDSAAFAVSRWTGATRAPLGPWTWPPTLTPGGHDDQPLNARRTPSPVFDPLVSSQAPRR